MNNHKQREYKEISEALPSAELKPNQRLTLTVKEAAKIIGLSRNATYQACQQGLLPHIRIGRRILIPVKALEKMLAEAGKERGD